MDLLVRHPGRSQTYRPSVVMSIYLFFFKLSLEEKHFLCHKQFSYRTDVQYGGGAKGCCHLWILPTFKLFTSLMASHTDNTNK